MLRVMEEYGIEDRDAFLAHSMNFDLDDNGYLKKAEFVEAAKAFTAEATIPKQAKRNLRMLKIQKKKLRRSC